MEVWFVYRVEHPQHSGVLGRVLSVHQHEEEARRSSGLTSHIIRLPIDHLRGPILYRSPVYGLSTPLPEPEVTTSEPAVEAPVEALPEAPETVCEEATIYPHSTDVFLWEAASGKARKGSPRIHIRAVEEYENDEILLMKGETLCGVTDTHGKSRHEPITCSKCMKIWSIAFGGSFEQVIEPCANS